MHSLQMPALQKKHKKSSVHNIKSVMNTRYGAGGRTRTGTLSPAVDFESTTSANSITPAHAASATASVYRIPAGLSIAAVQKTQRQPACGGQMPARSNASSRDKTAASASVRPYTAAAAGGREQRTVVGECGERRAQRRCFLLKRRPLDTEAGGLYDGEAAPPCPFVRDARHRRRFLPCAAALEGCAAAAVFRRTFMRAHRMSGA